MDCNKKRTVQGALLHLGHLYSVMNYQKLQQLGIHPGQVPMICIIHSQEGINQKELADMLHIKPPTVAVAVKRMENAGILTRKQDQNDARITRVYLTEEGKKVAQEILVQVDEDERVLTAFLSEEEKRTALNLLEKMIQSLEIYDKDTE